MAGIIAANKNGEVIHGVAYNAQIIPMRFGDNDEPFFFGDEIAQSWKLSFDAGAKSSTTRGQIRFLPLK